MTHEFTATGKLPLASWELREQVAERLDLGETLPRLEADLIDPALGLDDEQRAATWLFAWSYCPAATAARGSG